MASGTRCSKDFHSLLCGPREAYRDTRFPLGLAHSRQLASVCSSCSA